MITAPDIGTKAVMAVTFFSDHAAATKREEALHLYELANRIAITTAANKAALPWLKGAKFGDAKTPLVLKPDGKRTGGSLRHNENVLAISAVEGDYDGEQMSVIAAAERLRTAGVLSLVYTSPSHTDDTPRWRVIAPLSAEYPPVQRDAFMGRLNGLFGGIFSGESWTLSQSYYYGSVNRSPSHRVELIDGAPIDLMHQLDAGAIGKPGAKAGKGNGAERPVSAGGTSAPASDARLEAWRQSVVDALRSEAVEGQKHFALLRHATALGGIQAAAGFSDAAAIQWLMDALPDTVLNWDAAKRTAADGLARGRAKPIELEDRPRPFSNGPHSPFDTPDHDAGDPPHTHKPNGADAPPEPPEGNESESKPEAPDAHDDPAADTALPDLFVMKADLPLVSQQLRDRLARHQWVFERGGPTRLTCYPPEENRPANSLARRRRHHSRRPRSVPAISG